MQFFPGLGITVIVVRNVSGGIESPLLMFYNMSGKSHWVWGVYDASFLSVLGTIPMG